MKKKDPESTSLPPSAPSGPRMTPEDIQSKEFRIARFRGYKERDVDEFLDQLTVAWGSVLEENRRLRAGAPAAGPPPGALGAGPADAQAEEIVRRAQEEAERILREARSRVAALGASRAEAGGDHQAVTAFLNEEREFLRSLATLVQGHAEGVKGMAREVFTTRDAPPIGRPSDARVPAEAAIPEPPAVADEPKDEPKDEPRDEPIRVEEPEPAAVSRDAEATAAPGDRSLRELFWGEE